MNTKVKYVQCHVGTQLRQSVVNSIHYEKQKVDMELFAAGVMISYDDGQRKIVPFTNIIYVDLLPDEAEEQDKKIKLAKAN